jgi:hypothetical protein
MVITQAEWRRQQQIQVEGTAYDILVRMHPDGSFQSSWTCWECGEKTVTGPASPTADQALLHAEMSIGGHHQLFHGVCRRPRPR